MSDRLNPKIMEVLTNKLNKTEKQIRPRLSELRRKHSGLTMNAAAQIYAQSKGTSIMAKLNQEDRQALATVQTITQVNTTSVHRVDKRTLNINNSPIHNLSFGDRNSVSQTVISLDDSLSELSDKIDNSESLTSEEKSDYKSDIQTVASQVGKSKPNRQIVKAAWDSIKGLATVEGFAQSIERITPLIKPFIG